MSGVVRTWERLAPHITQELIDAFLHIEQAIACRDTLVAALDALPDDVRQPR